ncbi:MAG: helix-turn-helix domain-containing protein [Planctomycetota bacterium]|nr:MAG: helix-turn-helix domain-containing protein [Planctomycetota bacterium]
MTTTRLLNLAEAAQRLGYSVSGFRKLVRSGRGPRFVRLAPRGHFRFVESDLAEFLEQAASAPVKRHRAPIKSQFGLDYPAF